MIWDSSFWKKDLDGRARRLRERKSQTRWGDASQARTEQDVMLAFYSIRKLIEADKLTTAVRNSVVEIRSFPWRGKRVNQLNWHRLDELYDLASPHVANKRLMWLCNQVIHSYVFLLQFQEAGGLAGVLLSSDFERNRALYCIDIDPLIELLERVVVDEPERVEMKLNSRTGDYDVRLFAHAPRESVEK